MHSSEFQRMCSKKSSSKIKLRFVLYYIEIFIYMKTKNDKFWSVSLKLFYWAQTLKLGEVYGKYKQFCGNIIWKRWRVYVKKQLNICEIKQKYIYYTKICVSSYFRFWYQWSGHVLWSMKKDGTRWGQEQFTGKKFILSRLPKSPLERPFFSGAPRVWAEKKCPSEDPEKANMNVKNFGKELEIS